MLLCCCVLLVACSGVLILSRLTIHHFSFTNFETNMCRKLLVAHTHIRGEPVAIGTVHLESLSTTFAVFCFRCALNYDSHSFYIVFADNMKLRIKQMGVSFPYLKNFANSMLMG